MGKELEGNLPWEKVTSVVSIVSGNRTTVNGHDKYAPIPCKGRFIPEEKARKGFEGAKGVIEGLKDNYGAIHVNDILLYEAIKSLKEFIDK